MWMRNIAVFSGADAMPWSVAELDQMLAQHVCKPVGQQSVSSEGFVPPLKGQDPMAFSVDGFIHCVYQETVRLLPGPVIKELLDEKVEQIEQDQGRRVGRKEKADIKDQITFELLPRAFTRSRRINVLIDSERQRLLVDASSASRAEQVVSTLRRAVNSLPVTWPSAQTAPAESFGLWLRDPTVMPDGFTLGDRCELKGIQDQSASVRFSAVDLGREEILAHLDADMFPVRVNLCWNDELEFDLADTLEIKRLRPLDLIRDNINNIDAEDAVAELLARISLQGHALRAALDSLYAHFEITAKGAS